MYLIKNDYISKISETIDLVDLQELFDTYFNNNNTNLRETYIQNCFDFYTHAFTFDFISGIFNLSNIFNFPGINSLTEELTVSIDGKITKYEVI